MMNEDEKFQQKWDFRRRDDGDSSSDDSKSRSSGDNKHNIVSYDLVLLDNDEIPTDTPRCPKNDNLDTNKKVKSNRTKKNTDTTPNNKSTRRLVVKESQKRRKSWDLESKEMVMFEDLKRFGDSLIHELKLAREDLSAQMRQETRMSTKKKVKHCKNKDVQPERSMKSNVTSNASDFSKAFVKHERVLEPKTNYDRVASSPFLTQPTVVLPKPHLHRNSNLLNDHKNLRPEREIGKMLHGFPALKQVQFASFFGQNCSGNAGVGFPVPLHQGLGCNSNISSQIYENSFGDKRKLNLRSINGGNPALSEYGLANSRIDGGFVSLRSEDVKDGQFYNK